MVDKIRITETERKHCHDCHGDFDDRLLLLVGRSAHPEEIGAPVYRCLSCDKERETP